MNVVEIAVLYFHIDSNINNIAFSISNWNSKKNLNKEWREKEAYIFALSATQFISESNIVICNNVSVKWLILFNNIMFIWLLTGTQLQRNSLAYIGSSSSEEWSVRFIEVSSKCFIIVTLNIWHCLWWVGVIIEVKRTNIRNNVGMRSLLVI